MRGTHGNCPKVPNVPAKGVAGQGQSSRPFKAVKTTLAIRNSAESTPVMWGGVAASPQTPSGATSPTSPVVGTMTHQEALDRAKERIRSVREARTAAQQYDIDVLDPLSAKDRACAPPAPEPNNILHAPPPAIVSDFYNGVAPPATPLSPRYDPSDAIAEKYNRRTGIVVRPGSPVRAASPAWGAAGLRSPLGASSRALSTADMSSPARIVRPRTAASSVNLTRSPSTALGGLDSSGGSPRRELVPYRRGGPLASSHMLYSLNASTRNLSAQATPLGPPRISTSRTSLVGELRASQPSLNRSAQSPAVEPTAQLESSSSQPSPAARRPVDSLDQLQALVLERAQPGWSHQLSHLEKWTCMNGEQAKFALESLVDPLAFYATTLREGPDPFLTFAVRRPELEGLFVGNLPFVRDDNLAKFRCRLQLGEREPEKAWLSPDKQLLRLADMTVLRPTRQPLLLTADASAELRFASFRGTFPTLDEDPRWDNLLVLDKPQRNSLFARIETQLYYVLVIRLGRVALCDHPLMIPENRLANSLVLAVQQLHERSRVGEADYLSRKLAGLRETYHQQKRLYKEYLSEYEQFVHAKPSASASDDAQTQLDIASEKTGGGSSVVAAQQKWELATRQRRRLSRMRARMQELRDAIVATRALRDTELQTDRLLEFKALQLWQRLKALRVEQGFSSTSVRLLVSAESANRQDDVEVWKHEIKAEIADCIEQHKAEHERAMLKFQAQLETWTRKNERRNDPSVNQSETTKAPPQQPEYQPLDQTALRASIKEKLEKCRRPYGAPILTLHVAYTEPVTDALRCPRVEQQRRMAIDQLEYRLRLYYNNKLVTSTAPARIDLASFSLNISQVSLPAEIASARHGKDDSVAFALRVFEEPESFRVELFEHAQMSETCQAELFVPLPPPSHTENLRGLELGSIEFTGSSGPLSGDAAAPSGALQIQLTWGVDATGRTLGPRPDRPLRMLLQNPIAARGLVAESDGCSVGGTGLVRTVDPMASFGPTGTLNLRKMMEWLRDTRIDPNNPMDARLMQLKRIGIKVEEAFLKSAGRSADQYEAVDDDHLDSVFALSFVSSASRKQVFRCSIPPQILQAALGLDVATISRSGNGAKRRQNLLQARFNNQVVTHGPIPLNDNEIVDSTFERVLDTSRPEDVQRLLYSRGGQYPGFLKRVRAHALVAEARRRRKPRHAEYVREQRLEFAQDEGSIWQWLFRVRRPLRPERLDRLAHVASRPETCQIVVQVGCGHNIPLRAAGMAAGSRVTTLAQLSPEEVLHQRQQRAARCFVEVHFMGQRSRTVVREGANPVWNELLSLPVPIPQQDTVAEALLESNLFCENVHVHLYDEVLVNMLEDTRDMANKRHYRWERVWLGSVTIPFAAIYERAKISGSYHVHTPPLMVGYERPDAAGGLLAGPQLAESVDVASASFRRASPMPDHHLHPLDDPSAPAVVPSPQMQHDVVFQLDSTSETLLDLFITLEPPLEQPQALALDFGSLESSATLQQCRKWEEFAQSSPAWRKRAWKATTITLEGQVACVCAFVRPMELPPGIQTAEHASRFVSLLPYLPRGVVLGGRGEVWCTAPELFSIGAGDHDEHAALLCSYLLQLGKNAFVVLGRGIPEGRTAYTAVAEPLIEGEMSVTLINPVTGQWYRARDAHCPLKEVGCVFNHVNVWGNIQEYSDPARVWWAVSDVRCWKPLFSTEYAPPAQFGGAAAARADPNLLYPPLKTRYLGDLERSIEKAVVKAIEDWRTRLPTKWNRIASRMFHSVACKLEDFSKNRVDIPTAQILGVLPEWRSLNTMYRICGFPLHFAYTDMNTILSAVQSTDLYNNEDATAEFALAVHCVGYCEKVVSCWVCIAVLARA